MWTFLDAGYQLGKGTGEPTRVLEMFLTLIPVVIIWVYTYGKICWAVYLTFVHIMVCTVYFTKKEKGKISWGFFCCSCWINMTNTSFIQRFFIKTSKKGLCAVKIDVITPYTLSTRKTFRPIHCYFHGQFQSAWLTSFLTHCWQSVTNWEGGRGSVKDW